jgi:hypothetical protein
MREEMDLQKFKPWVEKTAAAMHQSAICMNIFTDDYGDDVQSLVQFSLAILLDKPIYLLAPEGRKIPRMVNAIVRGIEFYKPGDKNSMEAATMRILKSAKEMGLST